MVKNTSEHIHSVECFVEDLAQEYRSYLEAMEKAFDRGDCDEGERLCEIALSIRDGIEDEVERVEKSGGKVSDEIKELLTSLETLYLESIPF